MALGSCFGADTRFSCLKTACYAGSQNQIKFLILLHVHYNKLYGAVGWEI